MKQLAILAGLLGSAWCAAGAQERLPDIPRDYRPPPGMCRVWLDNVPAGQQPAPTDCPSAVRNRPANGRVVFGDDYVNPDSKRDVERVKGGTLLRNFVRPLTEERRKDEKKPDDKKADEKKKRPDDHP